MKKVLISLLLLTGFIFADPTVILVMKTAAKDGTVSESDALPDIVSSRLSKYQNYRSIVWSEIDEKLGKEKTAEILRCQDSSCIVKFTDIIRQYHLNPSYMIFCSIARYDGDFTVTLKIADAVRGTSFGMVSTTCSSLESFHTSGIVENIIRKIPAYVSRSGAVSQVKPISSFPGFSALGRDSSYFSILSSNSQEIREYINLFVYHDERRGLFINKGRPIDTIRFPSIAVYKPDLSDTTLKNAAFTITYLDSLIKNRSESQVSIVFNNDKSHQIRQVVFTCDVPSQTRYGSDHYDLRTSLLEKIVNSGFDIVKSDSGSGLYGVSYHYYYAQKYDISDVNLRFIADASKFTLTIEKP